MKSSWVLFVASSSLLLAACAGASGSPSPSQGGDAGSGDTQVDAGDFSAERSCDRLDFDPPIGCHGLRLSSGILQEAT